jgi:hypothetical protein
MILWKNHHKIYIKIALIETFDFPLWKMKEKMGGEPPINTDNQQVFQ